jgi:DNA-binding NtrC family response regulator
MTPDPTVDAERVRAVLPQGQERGRKTKRLSDGVRDFEKQQIEAALASEGTVTKAAARLGLERSHLYKKMKKLGFRPETLES